MSFNCPKCTALADEQDNFCRRCGRSLRPGTGFWYTHSGIILLAFVLGPFALIPLWLSRLLGRTAKILYTLAILLFSAYMAFVSWQTYRLMKDLLDYSLQGMLGPGVFPDQIPM